MSNDTTNVPAIPALSGITDPEIRKVLTAIKELLEVRDGRRGNELDQFVKIRDITDAGIAQYHTNRKKVLRPDERMGDYTPPSVLTNFEAAGGYTEVMLSWDVVNGINYPNFAYVEIYRSTTDALGTAVKIGQTTASLYTDSCGSTKSYYYWGRLVSLAGVVGPFNAVHGALGETAVDVVYLLGKLQGAITESQLYSDLGARIDLIDDAGALSTTVTERLDTLYSQVEAGFTPIDTFNAYVTADAVFAEQVRGLVFIDPTDGTVSALEGVIITADTDRNYNAIQFTTLNTAVSGNTVAITAEQKARSTADSANATSIISLRTDVETNYATNTALATASSTLTSALATSTSTLTARLNDAGGGVAMEQKFSVQASSITGLQGQYTLKIQAGDVIAGFGLAVDNSGTSSFVIRADRFALAPGVGSAGPVTNCPFYVLTSPQTIDGVSVPIGTWMSTAFIANATITGAKIGTATITNAHITSGLDAAKITVGVLEADRMTANIVTAVNANVTGTINAERINTHGLVIRNASGVPIFTSGSSTQIDSAYVSPAAAWLNSNVSLGSLGYTGDTNATAGATIGTNLHGIMTGVNISTFIEGAAINYALIGSVDAATITVGKIQANQIEAVSLAAVQANIGTLAALRSDMGDISAGTITLDTTGYIRSGQSSFDSGTGFFLGRSGGVPVFSLGDASKGIVWDGSTFTVRGQVINTPNITPTAVTNRADTGNLSSTVIVSSDATAWTHIMSCAITSTGQKIDVTVNADLATQVTTGQQLVKLRILRDTTPIYDPGTYISVNGGISAYWSRTFMDQPAAGAHTYYLQAQRYNVGIGAKVLDRSMSLVELKV